MWIRQMRFHYDFEFKENGVTIEPISLGMVDDNGRELYLINTRSVRDFQERKYFNKLDDTDLWLEENVFNHITEDDIEEYSMGTVTTETFQAQAAAEVYHFICSGLSYGDNVELWGYFAAYDHVCLSQLFGRMIDLPAPMPMFTNELMTIRNGMSKPPRPASLPEHHALIDAKYQKLIYDSWSQNVPN